MTDPCAYADPRAVPPAAKPRARTPAVFGVSWLAGIIIGFVSLNQIRVRGELGRALAIAAIIAGFVLLAATVTAMALVFATSQGKE